MQFKEFSEFPNLEEEDYDIKSGLRSNEEEPDIDSKQQIMMEFYALTGILEEDELNDSYLMEEFGVSVAEYLKPTRETIEKVRTYVEGKNRKHR